MTNTAIAMKNSVRAMLRVAFDKPVKPNKPATKEITKKIKASRSMYASIEDHGRVPENDKGV